MAPRLPLAVLIGITLTACGSADLLPTAEQPAQGPLLAKNPPPVSTDWVFDDLAGVSSDGRGAYSDGQCGVSAIVYNSAGGNGQLRPANSRSECGYVRSVTVNWGAGTSQPDQMVALGLWFVAAGTVGAVNFSLRTGVSSCVSLAYNAETGAQVQVTAGTTGVGKRTWLVESLPPHLAGCYVSERNGRVWDGVQRVVPLRLTITER